MYGELQMQHIKNSLTTNMNYTLKSDAKVLLLILWIDD